MGASAVNDLYDAIRRLPVYDRGNGPDDGSLKDRYVVSRADVLRLVASEAGVPTTDAGADPHMHRVPATDDDAGAMDSRCVDCGKAIYRQGYGGFVGPWLLAPPAEDRLAAADAGRATWTCTVTGPYTGLPPAADLPMRLAVREAYRRVTGNEATRLWSGWNGAARADTPSREGRSSEPP